MSKNFLSIIVPAYRQEKTIKQDLENIDRVMSDGLKDASYEIICVIDGTTIDKTSEYAKKVKSPFVKVFDYKINKGKGYAVRYGMSRAKGDLILFLDAGMEISPKGIMMLMSHMEWYNADIIVGSKRHPASRVNYPFLRRIYSIGYHFLARVLFGLPLKDTQSGIKIFRRAVVEKILPRLLVKTYAMDIEMLALSWHFGFRRIYEAPIEVTFDKKSSNISSKTIFYMIWDTLAIYYRLRILHYYDDSNKKNWITDSQISISSKDS